MIGDEGREVTERERKKKRKKERKKNNVKEFFFLSLFLRAASLG